MVVARITVLDSHGRAIKGTLKPFSEGVVAVRSSVGRESRYPTQDLSPSMRVVSGVAPKVKIWTTSSWISRGLVPPTPISATTRNLRTERDGKATVASVRTIITRVRLACSQLARPIIVEPKAISSIPKSRRDIVLSHGVRSVRRVVVAKEVIGVYGFTSVTHLRPSMDHDGAN